MNEKQSHVFNTPRWHKTCLMPTHGKGIYVYDSEGKSYLDAIGGTHVIPLFYCVNNGVKIINE